MSPLLKESLEQYVFSLVYIQSLLNQMILVWHHPKTDDRYICFAHVITKLLQFTSYSFLHLKYTKTRYRLLFMAGQGRCETLHV